MNRHAAALKIKEPLEYPLVVDTVMASLLNADANVSAAALDTLRKVKDVEKRPDFQIAMNKLQNSTNPRLKLIATNVLQGQESGRCFASTCSPGRSRLPLLCHQVEPILASPGPTAKPASSATPAM